MNRQILDARRDGGVVLTARRNFVAVASLGAVSLYGLWATLGAAPLRIWDLDASDLEGMNVAAGHGGHGTSSGPTPDRFRRMAEEYNAGYAQPDGSIAIGPAQGMQGMDMASMAPGDDGAMTGMDMASHSSHAMPAAGKGESSHAATGEGEASHAWAGAPLDAYILAQQWSFEPAVLRLAANQPYRLRMMAVDVAHGASIQLGRAGHVIRLPRGVLVERELTFTKPGDYLLYCTMYCGEGHHYMSGKIIVSGGVS